MNDMETRKLQQKESVYRKLYSSILQKHKGVLQQPEQPSSLSDVDDNVFDAEQQLLNRIFQTEVQNLLLGVGTTAFSFALLRTAKTRAMSSVFGEAKAKALVEANVRAKQVGTEGIQNRVAFFVESMFSVWVGYRSYDYASHHRSDASWDAVAEIPLCQGRSRISEALCPEWIETTKTHVPGPFWDALKNGKLRDQRTWTVIHDFSVNCERRLSMEEKLRRENSLSSDSPVVLPERISTATQ